MIKKPNVLVFRRKRKEFNSIENVFNSLLPSLNVTKVELPEFSEGFFPRLRNIRFIRNLKASVVHITGHDHYLLLFPLKRSVLTIHDIESLKRKSGVKRFIFKLIWFDIPILNAKAITTISDFSKSEIKSVLKVKKKIHVISNPLTLPITYTPKVFNSQCPRILHIGVKENKNLDRLIQGISGILCQLVIIGERTEKLENLLKKYKIDFLFKGGLSNEELVNEYYECDIVSFVSTYEGFGLPIIEAQVAGRVIITSNKASMPEIAGEGALLVNPFSIKEIRDGIILLCNDEIYRSKVIKRGLENTKRFDNKNIANKYKELYEELLY